jgi:putative ABC transport system permease protein
VGSAVTYFPIRDFQVEHGRSFTEAEVEAMGRVAVIGPVTAASLFQIDDPINKTVKINGINFRVVGILKAKGDQGWFNADDIVVIPYTTAMEQVFGMDYLREIDVQAQEGADLKKVEEDITALLRKRHRRQEGAQNDFQVRNQADMIQAATEANQTFTVLLAGIASISLLVGGIGIMNIMLVSVTERTREIGIRMAIGAKRRNIKTQFLVESIIISGLGGLIGVTAGVATARLIPQFTQFITIIQLPSIILALSFSAMVGIFFGWYPARRAANLDPIEALRYE